MKCKPHSNEWYDELAKRQGGYFYPWESIINEPNGEFEYLKLVEKYISKDKNILDVGCGHGDVALNIAHKCKSIIAYDRVLKFIKIAQDEQEKRNIKNITLICVSSKDKDSKEVLVPADDNSVDLVISRRGPLHWIEDVLRFAKTGARLIQLNPGEVEIPYWNKDLPPLLQKISPLLFNPYETVQEKLRLVGLDFEETWNYSASEYLPNELELYKYLTFGKFSENIPSFNDCKNDLKLVFQINRTEKGLIVKNNRFLWTTTVIKKKS